MQLPDYMHQYRIRGWSMVYLAGIDALYSGLLLYGPADPCRPWISIRRLRRLAAAWVEGALLATQAYGK